MKKIIFIIAIMLTHLVTFSQIKHITFIDSLRLSNVGGNNTFRSIVEFPDNQDYFLGCEYGNELSELQHYVSRLDYRGSLLWDTIYTFEEPFAGNGGSSQLFFNENQGSIVANTVLYGATETGTAPFVYMVADNGNVDWNYYYTADEFPNYDYNSHKAFKTNDGGVLIYGRTYDVLGQGFKGSPPTQYGYMYKLDQAGNIDWSKFYTNKDSIDCGFSAVNVLGNGEILFAGEAQNYRSGGFKLTEPGMNDNFLNIGKLDETGGVIWNTALIFDSIVNNEISCNINSIQVKGNEAFVLFTYYNSNESTDEAGIVNVDVNSGVVNWIKGYSLASDAASVGAQTSLILNNQYVFAYNFYGDLSGTGVLALDDNGSVTNYTSFVEEPGNSSFLYEIQPTLDNGFIALGGLNAGKGTMLYKADKLMKTYCPNEEEVVPPTTIDLTATPYSNILDSVFDVNVTSNTMNITNTTNNDGFTNVDCKCELLVDGYTYDVLGAGMDSVLVSLYKFDPMPGEYALFDTMTTLSTGYYRFNSLPEGDYVVKAEPNLEAYPTYLNTYFGMPNEVHQWDSAYVINLTCGNTPLTYNIDVMEGVSQTGTWTCNGYVYEYFGFNPTNKLAPGDPIGDIDITVEQSPGGAISSTTTDPSGYYEFTGLNNNATFIVRADIPGLPNDSIYTFTVSPGDGVLDSLNFYVDTVGVYILTEDIFTSVKNINSNDLSYDVVPNPTKGLINLTIETSKEVEVEIVITNIVGEVMYSNTYEANVGKSKYPINLAKYTQGIYFVRINQGDDYIIKKIIKQ